MIRLYQYPGLNRKTTLSAPCAKARMALDAKGLEYELVNLNLPSQVRKINPRGRVPVVDFDGDRVVDSVAILDELDRRYPDPPFLPDDPRQAAEARMLEDWANDTVYFYGIALRFLDPANFERLRRECLDRLPIPVRWFAPRIALGAARRRAEGQGVGLKAPETVLREFSRCVADLSARLDGREWLVGDRWTRGDLAVAACMDQYRLHQLTPAAAQVVEDAPGISPWLDRVHTVCRNVALPEAKG